ncbi:MAG TPA: methyltransferase domain-containing protein [Acidimicrobiales bacterium]|nr:methyltransferase domain-containing protein [Acidimicrobiales bacterium]
MDGSSVREPYYRESLALIHHLGFGFHADACAPGIIDLLAPVLDRHGVVVEVGCGSGLLTRHLVEAGHRVIATDASEAMLDLARRHAPGAEDIRSLRLPDDPVPAADAIVSVGHVLSYLHDEASVDRALAALAGALRPGGVLAIDLCDLAWGRAREKAPPQIWRDDQWVLVTEFSVPSPNRFVRVMTTFVRNPDGSWRRDDERHDNVLVDTTRVPMLLAAHGVEASVVSSFGDETLAVGLMAVVGRRSG